ncbi:hypothetical protein HPB48_008401 [Haemaphysalis longicornis]|uniref:Ig-like domain-containing protein n=1 Tax=Haemaphysalis longicornis TaxID=44386 RepID=A0A9J6GZS0_HAELO|nr:hypothetical protein HPB48_008401 [Haemaphysalis longicornis]
MRTAKKSTTTMTANGQPPSRRRCSSEFAPGCGATGGRTTRATLFAVGSLLLAAPCLSVAAGLAAESTSLLLGVRARLRSNWWPHDKGHAVCRRLPAARRPLLIGGRRTRQKYREREKGRGRMEARNESPEVHVLIPSNLRRGDTAEIFCSLRRGSLPVVFQWLHNGRPIMADKGAGLTGNAVHADREPFWKVENRDRRSELLIENIGARQIGNYTCIASNAAGKTSFTASLLVEVPPTWLHMPGDQAAVVGSSLTVDCSALGHPTPVTKWTRSQYPSETLLGNKDSHISVLANGSLVIAGVRTSDSGLYRCDVENGVGTLITKTINLTVSVPPLIRKQHETIKVRLGNIVTLHCGASGEEPLRIGWVKDEKSIERSLKERYDVIDRSFPGGIASDLLIHKSALADTGEFACHVTNSEPLIALALGKKKPKTAEEALSPDLQGPSAWVIEFNASLTELPSPPIGVKVDDIGKRSARVSWKKPFAEVNQFLLRYWRENGQCPPPSRSPLSSKPTSPSLLATFFCFFGARHGASVFSAGRHDLPNRCRIAGAITRGIRRRASREGA